MFVQITIRVTNHGQPKDVWFAAETNHHSMQEMLSELRDEGDICLTRFDTRQIAPGVRVVIGQSATIQTRDTILSVSEPQFDLIGQTGKVLYRRAS